ncbi:MAG TPA: nucleotidyltransferase family protein [Gemmatimonadaceae bacterium]
MSDTPPRVGCVVLAAGGSTRFGSPKQLLSYEGEPLVRRAVAAAVEAGADPVVVVLGAHPGLVAETLPGLQPVRAVVNRSWESGLASSLNAGLREITDDGSCDGVLVMLADQPLVDAASLRQLLSAFDSDHRLVAAEYAGVVGVPAVFGKEYFGELMELTGDAGAGAWLRERSTEVTRIPMSHAAVDIDTPSDAVRLKGNRESRR